MSKIDARIAFTPESKVLDKEGEESVLEPPRKSYGSTATPIPSANLVALVPYLVNSCLRKLARMNVSSGGGGEREEQRPAKRQRSVLVRRDPTSSERETSGSDESESESEPATSEEDSESEGGGGDVGMEEGSGSESDFIIQTGGMSVPLQRIQATAIPRFQKDTADAEEYERPEQSRGLMESYIINN